MGRRDSLNGRHQQEDLITPLHRGEQKPPLGFPGLVLHHNPLGDSPFLIQFHLFPCPSFRGSVTHPFLHSQPFWSSFPRIYAAHSHDAVPTKDPLYRTVSCGRKRRLRPLQAVCPAPLFPWGAADPGVVLDSPRSHGHDCPSANEPSSRNL